MQLRAILAVSLGLAYAILTGCGVASQVPTKVPGNIAEIQSTPLGAVLKTYGYTPVTVLFSDNKPAGHVYVACNNETNISKCGSDLHNKGTNEHPNVYVLNNKVVQLEGPHTGETDDRSYYIRVPAAYQDFAALTPEQQKALLGVMPEVAKAIGRPMNGGNAQSVLLSIGQVDAWVAR